MTKIQIIDETTQKILGEHELSDILIQTSDTFGSLRWMGNAEYHGCKESDRGRGIVITTKHDDFTHHVYPTHVYMRYID